MRGSEWNRLVGAPTAIELDAALADVRVRAIPIARRNARNRSLGLAVSVLLVGVIGVAVGREMSPGLRLIPEEEADAHRLGSWVAPEVVSAGYAPVRSATWRWHIQYQDVLDDQRFNAGEAWVEGPPGTYLDFELRSFGSRFEGSMRASVRGDSAAVRVLGKVTQDLGTMHNGVRVHAEGRFDEQNWYRSGEALVLRPFGTAGEVQTTLRIDGPFAPAPQGRVYWIRADTLRVMVARRFWTATAQRVGARSGYRGASAISIMPLHIPLPIGVRLSVPGHPPALVAYAPFLGNGVRVDVPGLPVRVFITATMMMPGHAGETCLFIQTVARSRSERNDSGIACFSEADPWSPADVRLTRNAGRLRVERVRPPGN